MSSKDPLLSFIADNTFKIKFKQLKQKPDCLLFISDFCIPNNLAGMCKYAVYTDSFVPIVAEISRSNNKFGYKLFMKHFIKNYKEDLDKISIIFTQNEWSRKGFIEDFGIDENKIFNVGFGINIEPYLGPKNYNDELLLIVLRKWV